MDILNQIAQESKRIQAIEAKVFNVVKVPLITNNPLYIEPKTAFGVYKENGGEALGIVGGDYAPQQPKDLFKLFLKGILGNEQLTTDKLNFTEMNGGSKIRFSTPVGRIAFKNIAGQMDESDVTLNFQTGFDGRTKTSMYLSTLRLVCTNGMKNSFTEHECAFKNTSGNVNRAYNLIEDIQRQLNQVKTLEEMYLALNKVKVNQAQTKAFIQKVSGYNLSDESTFSPRKKNIVTNILESIDTEFARTGKTAYGLLQGITHYTNHKASGHQNSEYIFTQNGAKMNDLALKTALELI